MVEVSSPKSQTRPQLERHLLPGVEQEEGCSLSHWEAARLPQVRQTQLEGYLDKAQLSLLPPPARQGQVEVCLAMLLEPQPAQLAQVEGYLEAPQARLPVVLLHPQEVCSVHLQVSRKRRKTARRPLLLVCDFIFTFIPWLAHKLQLRLLLSPPLVRRKTTTKRKLVRSRFFP